MILDRVISEYKISARLGELHIAYCESPTVTVKESGIIYIAIQ